MRGPGSLVPLLRDSCRDRCGTLGLVSVSSAPKIVEVGKGRAAVLVLFTGESWSGETFGGTCLYFNRDGQWGAYTIKPSHSKSITQAEAWLVKRNWQAWC